MDSPPRHSAVWAVLDEIAKAAHQVGGVAELIAQTEASVPGRTVYRPGEVDWFDRDDWHEDGVASVELQSVRIVLVYARKPRTGAFRRLVARIRSAGYTPRVVSPLGPMTAILIHWGWSPSISGTGFTAENIWSPPPER